MVIRFIGYLLDRPLLMIALLMASLVGVMVGAWLYRLDRVQSECAERGGHVSHGLVGGSDVYLCIEPDGTAPTLIVGDDK